jgi:hypothetical protein
MFAINTFSMAINRNIFSWTSYQQDVFATGLSTICSNVVKLLQVVVVCELDNLVASCQQVVTTCQQAGNKQCEHSLMTSCWNNIGTSQLQVCYNLSCACVLQTQNMIMEFSTVLKVFAVACII